MTGRERVIKTLNMELTDRPPRDLWFVPYMEMFRNEDLKKVYEKFPMDFIRPASYYGKSPYAKGTPFIKGEYTDDFGCVWSVAEDGVTGEVKVPLIDEWEKLEGYRLPWEMLENAEFNKLEEEYKKTDKFVIGGSRVNPFERLQFLRGTENLFIDIEYGS
jgi:hypothetical protein